MKLLVRKLSFSHSIEETLSSLFKISQIKELFDERYVFDGELKPTEMEISKNDARAEDILNRLPPSGNNVYLVLTSINLEGRTSPVHGWGDNRKAIITCESYYYKPGVFDAKCIGFNSLIFGEIGHALGLVHHEYDSSNPCEISHWRFRGPGTMWKSIDEICFCKDCYRKLQSRI